MTKSTTDECIEWLNKLLRRFDDLAGAFKYGDDYKIPAAMRAQLKAAKEMSRAIIEGTDSEMVQAAIAWRETGGQ